MGKIERLFVLLFIGGICNYLKGPELENLCNDRVNVTMGLVNIVYYRVVNT